jgi:anti-sigma B factor antagonist
MLPVPQVRGRWGRLSSTGRSLQRFKSSLEPGAQAPGEGGCVKLARNDFSGAFAMQIEERKVGDVVVLDLKGKITLGEGDELLKDKVNSLVNQGHKKIILNLADVPYIDSAGLGEVVRTYTTVSRQAGSLKLLNLTKRITDLLSITKLLTVFETFDSENEAVRSFSASAKV